MFTGVYTALITPFKNGKIDYDAYARIIESQVTGGVDGVVPMGTTGESPTISHSDHSEVIRKTVEFANKRIKVIAGTGSNSTEEAINLTVAAAKAGADGVLLVNPYYNKPPQRALVAHFTEVSNAGGIPAMLYNIPGRTGINFMPESVAELVDKAPQIKAMKEASGDIAQMMRLIELCGDRIDILSGDDNLLLPLLAVGGKGVVSVVANIMPREVKSVVTNFRNGNLEEAKNIFYKILPICRAVFVETNPIPIKWVMSRAGFCSGDVRLPLMELAPDKQEIVRSAFAAAGVRL
jgi:4-hydroxy-tetrahydrodipicolinate synthase